MVHGVATATKGRKVKERGRETTGTPTREAKKNDQKKKPTSTKNQRGKFRDKLGGPGGPKKKKTCGSNRRGKRPSGWFAEKGFHVETHCTPTWAVIPTRGHAKGWGPVKTSKKPSGTPWNGSPTENKRRLGPRRFSEMGKD